MPVNQKKAETAYKTALETLKLTISQLKADHPLFAAANNILKNIEEIKKENDSQVTIKKRIARLATKKLSTDELTEGLKAIEYTLTHPLELQSLEKLSQFDKKVPRSNLKRNLKLFIFIMAVLIIIVVTHGGGAIALPAVPGIMASSTVNNFVGNAMIGIIQAVAGDELMDKAVKTAQSVANFTQGVAQYLLFFMAVPKIAITLEKRYELAIRKLEATIKANPLKNPTLLEAAQKTLNTIKILKNSPNTDVSKLIETLWMVNMELKHPPSWKRMADWPGLIYANTLEGPLRLAYDALMWPYTQEIVLVTLTALSVMTYLMPDGGFIKGACSRFLQMPVPLSGGYVMENMGVAALAEAVGICRVAEHLTNAAGWANEKLGFELNKDKPAKLTETLRNFKAIASNVQLNNKVKNIEPNDAELKLTKINEHFKAKPTPCINPQESKIINEEKPNSGPKH